jgi:hypothetical protein
VFSEQTGEVRADGTGRDRVGDVGAAGRHCLCDRLQRAC